MRQSPTSDQTTRAHLPRPPNTTTTQQLAALQERMAASEDRDRLIRAVNVRRGAFVHGNDILVCVDRQTVGAPRSMTRTQYMAQHTHTATQQSLDRQWREAREEKARNEATVDTLTAVQQEQQDKLKCVIGFKGHVCICASRVA